MLLLSIVIAPLSLFPFFCITENTKVIFTCDWGGVDGRE